MSVAVAGRVQQAELDQLVEEICLTLQITPTQFDLARQHYEAVGDWLAREGSPIAALKPIIYPQGSMALRTTVRPRPEREEYDLDLVLQVQPVDTDPMRLYNLVGDRLEAHEVYGQMLERMKRCLRLNYEHQFHLDILPARLDRTRGGTCIEVPDRALKCWMPSNPAGYVLWFEHQCDEGALFKAAREQVPLPPPLPEHQLQVLRQIVQLIKRRRDNAFRGADVAPRSVVLTTLAGHAYARGESLTAALEQVLLAIEAAIAQAHPHPIEVRNPTNSAELFSERWRDRDAYAAFTNFIRTFRAEVTALRAAEGLEAIALALDGMFGNELGQKAVRAYSDKVGKAKNAGMLRFGAPGIIIGGTEGRPSPKHQFHHGGYPVAGR
jgi:hypothetical protein